jgi:hypothetical protein
VTWRSWTLGKVLAEIVGGVVDEVVGKLSSFDIKKLYSLGCRAEFSLRRVWTNIIALPKANGLETYYLDFGQIL